MHRRFALERKSNLLFLLHSDGECICPPEFTGPHCEFLKVLVDMQDFTHYIAEDDQKMNQGIDMKGTDVEKASSSAPLILGLVVIAAFISAIFWKRRQSTTTRGYSSQSYFYEQPEFPLTPSGYRGDDGGASVEDDEYIFQDVSLTWWRDDLELQNKIQVMQCFQV